jgi:hypothetical protein
MFEEFRSVVDADVTGEHQPVLLPWLSIEAGFGR